MVKRIFLILAGLVMFAAGSLVAGTPQASARSCPDVEVVFARGTAETAPPVGLTGLSYVEALRAALPGKSVNVSAVNYPASNNFNNREVFVENVVRGINNMQSQVTRLVAACPDTDIVLGGYSQGAVVAGYTVTPGIVLPSEYARYEARVPKALPAEVASNVAAVVLFGAPSNRWLRDVGAPAMTIAPAYRDQTTRYCIAGDNVCDGSPVGQPDAVHVLYSVNGMTLDAAQFTARRI